LEDAIDFQNAIGRPRIEHRIRAFSSYLCAQAAEIPHMTLYTSNDSRISCAMTSLGIHNVRPEFQREYLRQR
jgi:selenocysteine lyase/cysteine desulfurase